jgi:hypothetical protein
MYTYIQKHVCVYIYLIHTHTHTPHTHTQEQINANSTRTLDMGTDAPEACTVVDHLARAVRSVAVRAVGTVSGDRLGRCRFELAVEDHEVLQVHVVGAHPALGDWNMENGLALEKEAGSSLWVAHAELPLKEDIGYKFVVWRAAREHSLGASTLRRLHIPTEGRKMVIKDRVGMEVLPEEKSKAFVRASPSSPALGGTSSWASGSSHVQYPCYYVSRTCSPCPCTSLSTRTCSTSSWSWHRRSAKAGSDGCDLRAIGQ